MVLLLAQKPHDAPLVLGRATPHPGILAAGQSPCQTGFAYRARPAYLLGFIDLKQRWARRANGEEQVGIDTLAGGLLAPVRVRRPRLAPEKAVARLAHRAMPPFFVVCVLDRSSL
jgi:hypothetical protein